MLMEKKRVILVDKASDWLQIWMTASSLDVKGNKIKKIANRLVFPNTVTSESAVSESAVTLSM